MHYLIIFTIVNIDMVSTGWQVASENIRGTLLDCEVVVLRVHAGESIGLNRCLLQAILI